MTKFAAIVRKWHFVVIVVQNWLTAQSSVRNVVHLLMMIIEDLLSRGSKSLSEKYISVQIAVKYCSHLLETVPHVVLK